MAYEHGKPQRDPIQDANNNVVDPPAIKKQARTMDETQLRIDPNAQSGFGEGMASLLTEKTVGWAEQNNQRRQIEAANRQGTSKAMNDIDAVKKRTGLGKFMLGQNIEYRASQQRMMQNRANESYIEMMTKIDEYAGDDPKTFQRETLNDTYEGLIHGLEGDEETVSLLTNHWSELSKKLADKQYTSNYAFRVNAAKQANKHSLRQQLQMYMAESNVAGSAEERAEIDKAFLKSFASNPTDHADAQDVAASHITYDADRYDEVFQAVSSGNVDLFKLFAGAGYLSNLSPALQEKADEAVDKYDTHVNRQATLLYDNVHSLVKLGSKLDPSDPNKSKANLDVLEALKTHKAYLEKSSSGSLRGQENIAAHNTKVTKLLQSVVEDEVKAKVSGYDVVALGGVLSQTMAGNNFNDGQTIFETFYARQGVDVGDISNKDLGKIITRELADLVGYEPEFEELRKQGVPPSGIVRMALKDPDHALNILDKLQYAPSRATLNVFKDSFGNMSKNFGDYAGEDGRPNEEWSQYMESFKAMYNENKNTLSEYLPPETISELVLLDRETSIGKSVEQAAITRDKLIENRGKRSEKLHFGQGGEKGKEFDLSRKQYLEKLVTDSTKWKSENISPALLNDVNNVFSDYLDAFKTQQEAKTATAAWIRSANSTLVGGTRVENTHAFKEDFGGSLGEAIDLLASKPSGKDNFSDLQTFFTSMPIEYNEEDSGTVPNSIDSLREQVPGLEVYYQAGTQDLVFHLPQGGEFAFPMDSLIGENKAYLEARKERADELNEVAKKAEVMKNYKHNHLLSSAAKLLNLSIDPIGSFQHAVQGEAKTFATYEEQAQIAEQQYSQE